jgi:hypothetical protein
VIFPVGSKIIGMIPPSTKGVNGTEKGTATWMIPDEYLKKG